MLGPHLENRCGRLRQAFAHDRVDLVHHVFHLKSRVATASHRTALLHAGGREAASLQARMRHLQTANGRELSHPELQTQGVVAGAVTWQVLTCLDFLCISTVMGADHAVTHFSCKSCKCTGSGCQIMPTGRATWPSCSRMRLNVSASPLLYVRNRWTGGLCQFAPGVPRSHSHAAASREGVEFKQS